jgi:hypothetical protein
MQNTLKRLINPPTTTSLCHSCSWLRLITSGRGSRFFLCRKAQDDPRYAKYPPQPILRCSGYERALPVEPPAAGDEQAEGD